MRWLFNATLTNERLFGYFLELDLMTNLTHINGFDCFMSLTQVALVSRYAVLHDFESVA